MSFLLRFFLGILVFFLGKEENSSSLEEKCKIFIGGIERIPEKILDSLVRAYQEVFSEPPWCESWSEGMVLEKIKKDLNSPKSFLVVFLDKSNVLGFVWGDIVDKRDIIPRAARAMEISSSEVVLSLPKKGILYCDEFALLRRGRGGPSPVKNMLRKALEYGYQENIRTTLFWSTPSSKIVPLARMMGYEKRGEIGVGEKKIIFLLNPNFKNLLKITKLNDRKIERILSLVQNRKKPSR